MNTKKKTVKKSAGKRPRTSGRARAPGQDRAPQQDNAPEKDGAPEVQKPKNTWKREGPKPEKTPEDLAAIALLDRLRTGDGDVKQVGLPLACIVKVIDYFEVPKANERYAMATVEGRDGRTWRMCIFRYYLETGMRALFISEDAALPMDDPRFVNPDVCKLKERVFKFGFGVKERRYVPSVKRSVYNPNCGVLYPLDDFRELKRARVGDVCAASLRIDSATDLHIRATMPRRKTWVPSGGQAR